MSGLFRRLARHASGLPQATVHAMARLPFQAPPELLPTDEGSAPILPLEHGAAQTPASEPTAPPRRAGEFVSDAQSQAPSRQSATEHPAPRRGESPALSPAPLVATTVRENASEASAEEGKHAPAESTRPAVRNHAHASEAASAASVLARVVPATTLASPLASSVRPGRAEPATVTGYRAVPEALLPAQAERATARAADAARPATAAAAEPTEVHVHIGRIEVTAVQAPAPPKRPSRSGQAPMSLDAYLAKRQRSPS